MFPVRNNVFLVGTNLLLFGNDVLWRGLLFPWSGMILTCYMFLFWDGVFGGMGPTQLEEQWPRTNSERLHVLSCGNL